MDMDMGRQRATRSTTARQTEATIIAATGTEVEKTGTAGTIAITTASFMSGTAVTRAICHRV